ncbi:Maltose phosphorylase [compost metagenome]
MESIRIVSMARHEIGAIRYSVTPLNFAGTLTVTPYLDGDIKNKDSNYDEKFWNEVEKHSGTEGGYLTLKTKKLDFHVTSAFAFDIVVNGEKVTAEAEVLEQ